VIPETSHHRFFRPRVFAGLALAGLVLALFAVWDAAGQPLWPEGYLYYDHALDRAMSARVGELLAFVSGCVGIALLVLAAALFGYWLMHRSRERHRAAH
jgi:membrane protein DedA with SNARE-associated domain